jgi:hypothetical protein
MNSSEHQKVDLKTKTVVRRMDQSELEKWIGKKKEKTNTLDK